MFSTLENKVVLALRNLVPSNLIRSQRISAGPRAEPSNLRRPRLVFTCTEFTVLPDSQMMDIPKENHEMLFKISAQVDIWADSLDKVEDLAFKIMGIILVHTHMIEQEATFDQIVGNLHYAFEHSKLSACEGTRIIKNSNSSKAEVQYSLESRMTVTQLDFSYGKIKIVDALLKSPLTTHISIAKPCPFLQLSPEAIVGIDHDTALCLEGKGISSIAQLALTEIQTIIECHEDSSIFIQVTKNTRRIAHEITFEILDRIHPFSQSFFTYTLDTILGLSGQEIHNETGKTLEQITIFQDNINELKTEFIKNTYFSPLTLNDFI